MKYSFSIIFFFLILFFSCSDDYENVEPDSLQTSSNQSIDYRAVTDCGFIPELCVRIYAEPLPPEIGFSSIIFDDGNTEYAIIAHKYFGTTSQLTVTDGESTYILAKTDDPFVQSFSSSIAVPDELLNLANLELSDIISESDLTARIGDKYNVSVDEDGNYVVQQSGTISGTSGNISVFDPCKFVQVATIRRYKEVLMELYGSSQSTNDAIDIAIEESITACTNDPCYECPDSRCVVDNLLAHPNISGSESLKFKIRLNYLVLLLDFDEDQKEWLRDHPEIVDELVEDYNLLYSETIENRTIGCGENICGAEGAANAHLNLEMNGYDVSDTEAVTLCDFYTSLYEDSKEQYECLVQSNSIAAYHSLLYEQEFLRIFKTLNENNENCAPFGKYVPCAKIVFSNPIAPENRRFCQLHINIAVNTLLCIPPVPESEGLAQNLDYSLRVELSIPDDLFYNIFSYGYHQTKIAELLSEGISHAWDLIEEDLSCSSAVTQRGSFENFFFGYIQDEDILSSQLYWGSSGHRIEVRKNFQTNVPDYSPNNTTLKWSADVLNCL